MLNLKGNWPVLLGFLQTSRKTHLLKTVINLKNGENGVIAQSDGFAMWSAEFRSSFLSKL
jgi:hypothetical protein